MEERAVGSVFVDDDVEVHTRYLDQSRLEQEVKLLRVYIADPLQALQALLLDVPAGSVYLQRRGSLTPNLVDGTGNALHGYELVSGSRWGSLMETFSMEPSSSDSAFMETVPKWDPTGTIRTPLLVPTCPTNLRKRGTELSSLL